MTRLVLLHHWRRLRHVQERFVIIKLAPVAIDRLLIHFIPAVIGREFVANAPLVRPCQAFEAAIKSKPKVNKIVNPKSMGKEVKQEDEKELQKLELGSHL